MSRAALSILVALALGLTGGQARATPPVTSMPPEVAALNERGVALYEKGERQAAFDELARAYALMPDAKKDGAGRDVVLGSMRAILIELYEQTGEVRHLCRARELLVVHLEALLLAFGEDSEVEDIPGTLWRLGQVRDLLAQRVRRPGEPADPCANAPAQVSPRPQPPRTDKPAPPAPISEKRGRGWIIGGSVGVGVGGALLGAMTYALATRRAIYVAIREIDARNDGSAQAQATVATLREAGVEHRRMALATGITGGLLAAAGITGLVIGRMQRRPSKVAVLPAASPWGASLTLRGAF